MQYLNIIIYKLVKQKLKIIIDVYTFKEYDEYTGEKSKIW